MAFLVNNRVQKVPIMSPPQKKKTKEKHMLFSMNCTKTSFQKWLFESRLAIYITCMNTCYKHNTNFCYTVIIIKNNQKYQNSCCIIDDSTAFWLFGLFHCYLHLQKFTASHFVYPADTCCISSTFTTLARKWKIFRIYTTIYNFWN